jgi:hypothetical protein
LFPLKDQPAPNLEPSSNPRLHFTSLTRRCQEDPASSSFRKESPHKQSKRSLLQAEQHLRSRAARSTLAPTTTSNIISRACTVAACQLRLPEVSCPHISSKLLPAAAIDTS